MLGCHSACWWHAARVCLACNPAAASGTQNGTAAESHHIVLAGALGTLISSDGPLSEVSNDGLALVFGSPHFSLGGSLNDEMQLLVIVWDLLTLVIETAPDGDSCSGQLVDLGYRLPMRDLQSAHTQAAGTQF